MKKNSDMHYFIKNDSQKYADIDVVLKLQKVLVLQKHIKMIRIGLIIQSYYEITMIQDSMMHFSILSIPEIIENLFMMTIKSLMGKNKTKNRRIWI